MSRILRSKAARLDVADLWIYLHDRSPAAADRVLDQIDERLRMLADNPYLGRSRSELAKELRSFVVAQYTLFYRPLEDGIELVRVLHTSRDVGSEFD